jgi:hypothetical protein
VFSTGNRVMCKFTHNPTNGVMAISANWLYEPSEPELNALRPAIDAYLRTHGIGISQIDSIMANSAAEAEAIGQRFLKAGDN